MSYTVAQVQELFPEIQFCAGVGVLRHNGKHIEIGNVTANAGFQLNDRGFDLLHEVITSEVKAAAEEAPVEDAPVPAKPPRKKKAATVVEPATDPDEPPEFDLE